MNMECYVNQLPVGQAGNKDGGVGWVPLKHLDIIKVISSGPPLGVLEIKLDETFGFFVRPWRRPGRGARAGEGGFETFWQLNYCFQELHWSMNMNEQQYE